MCVGKFAMYDAGFQNRNPANQMLICDCKVTEIN